jgi:hypothetical protein
MEDYCELCMRESILNSDCHCEDCSQLQKELKPCLYCGGNFEITANSWGSDIDLDCKGCGLQFRHHTHESIKELLRL